MSNHVLGEAMPISYTSFSGADCVPILGDTQLPSVNTISYTVTYNQNAQHPRVKGTIKTGLFSEVGGCIHEIIKDISWTESHPQFKIHYRNELNGELLVLFKGFKIIDHSLTNDMDQIIIYENYNFEAKDVEYCRVSHHE